MHDKDLHLGITSKAEYGLGLWRYGIAATAIEFGLVALAYTVQRKREKPWIGHYCIIIGALQLITEVFTRLPIPSNKNLLLILTFLGYLCFVYFAIKLGKSL